LTSSLPHILALCLLPGVALAQGVPTNDSGLTARDIVETGDREADLAIQADKLSVRELISEIERDQLEALQRILDAQTSLGGQGLPAMVSGLEGGSGDPGRSIEAVYGSAEIDPNPGGAQMFGDASENIEQLIIRVAQETSGFAGVGRAGLSPVQWRALLQALIWQESRFNTFDGNIINALAAYNAGPGRVFEYGGVPPFAETQHYVTVIPERYNLYLSRIGGIEALGTIDPALLANANLSITGHGAAVYGNNSPAAIRQAALRIRDIVERISETEDVQESMALNTYARAELVRLVAARIRLQAARTRVLSAEELAQASARMAEGAFMNFTIREID